jgi:hypothetical protein
MASTPFILQSSDGVDITVERRLLEKFVVISDMIGDLGDEKPSEPILIPVANAKVLEKVVAWCQFDTDNAFEPDEDKPYSRKKPGHIDKWDFMNSNRGILKELIIVSYSPPYPSTCVG